MFSPSSPLFRKVLEFIQRLNIGDLSQHLFELKCLSDGSGLSCSEVKITLTLG